MKMSNEATQIFLRTKRDFWNSENVATLIHHLPIQPSAQSSIDWAEVTLKAGFSYEFETSQDCLLIMIPLVGEIHLDEKSAVDVGQCWAKSLKNGETLCLKNPYENTENHFLRIQIPFSDTVKPVVTSFSDDKLLNCVYPIFILSQEAVSLKLGMGKFEGRAEIELEVKGDIYVYCLVGAFEVQNCLLEKGDALKIMNTNKIEFEALSSDAFLFTLEM